MSTIQNKIVANFWFDQQAEDAAKFYTTVFKHSKMGKISYYGEEGREITQKMPGTVMQVEFWLEGQRFTALNGGPQFKFNEALSLAINCSNQHEIDDYWNKLTEEGDPGSQQCGWLKDKFGVSWQVVPEKLADWMSDRDQEKSGRVMKALLQMKKIDLNQLKKAYDGSEEKKRKPDYA
jgi:predicted 3-demethylubiquinone-9 3-methyltransferase (glyoxalase superfamily)